MDDLLAIDKELYKGSRPLVPSRTETKETCKDSESQLYPQRRLQKQVLDAVVLFGCRPDSAKCHGLSLSRQGPHARNEFGYMPVGLKCFFQVFCWVGSGSGLGDCVECKLDP